MSQQVDVLLLAPTDYNIAIINKGPKTYLLDNRVWLLQPLVTDEYLALLPLCLLGRRMLLHHQ